MKNVWCSIAGRSTALVRIPFLVFIALVSGGRVPAQVVSFPDTNLETAVRSTLSIPSPTPIYQTNLLALTNLYAGYQGITNLSGLESATNLTVFDLPGSPLTNIIVLTNFPKLTWLNIAFDNVLNISPIASLTNLNHLDIGGNSDGANHSITNITSLAALRALQWLSLYSLKVTDVAPLAGLRALTNLDLNFNQPLANTAALSGLTNLLVLNIAGDSITNLSFVTPIFSLKHLDLGYDSVTNLAPLVALHLAELLAHNNPITNASIVTNIPSLTLLTLSGDNLSNVTFLARMTNLRNLSIDNNPGLADLTPVLGLTNLYRLNIGSSQFTNLTSVATMTDLTELDMGNITGLEDISFLTRLTNLMTLDASNLRVGNIGPLSSLPQMQTLYLGNDLLTDIAPLLSLGNLGYVDLRGNLLNTNAGAGAALVIQQLQAAFVNVDFNPQNLSSTIMIPTQPIGDCVQPGQPSSFSVVASNSAGRLTYQWQFKDIDLPGQTADTLLLVAVTTNQAGHYRVLLTDDNSAMAASDEVVLYVGDPNCGRTITIQQQPVNQCAAPGDTVEFRVAATSTRTNLAYQWQFNGTNIAGATTNTLDLFLVGSSQSGFYDVVLADDKSTNFSATVQLEVVTNVTFPDPNLDRAVRTALSLGPSDPIPLSTLDNLTELYVNHAGIASLSGLECARQLNSLDLSYNPLTNAQFIGWLQSLTWLKLDNCGLTTITFLEPLTNLTYLEILNDQGQPNNNQIDDVSALAGLYNLTSLSADWNNCPVGWYKLGGLTNLTYLSIPGDCVNDLSFINGMMNLNYLDAANNSIMDSRPVANKHLFNWLSLSWNQLTNFAVGGLTNLGTLYLGGNSNLTDVSFLTNLFQVQWLGIDHSSVTNISYLAGRSNMQYLDVSYIATSNLTAISGLTALGTLWAGGNNAGTASFVTSLQNLGYLGLEKDGISNLNPLTGLTNLFYFTAENNNFTNISVLTNKTHLNYLYIAWNQVHDLTPLAGLTNLNNLSLGGNGLSDVTALANLRKMNWLSLLSNYVENLAPLAGMTNLTTLDLTANLVTNLAPVASLGQLRYLYPAFNQLTTLPSLAALTNLTFFDLNGNLLTNVAGASGMLNLGWFGLNNNRLTAITPLTNLPALRTFIGSTNLLTDPSGVGLLTGLTWMTLADNNLQDIHGITNLAALGYIDLRYNLLNTNSGSVAMTNIGAMQSHGTYVDYVPQKTVGSLAPVLLAPTWLGANQFRFTIQSVPSATLQIWASPNLATWSSVGFITNTTGSNNFTDTHATNNIRAYRAQQL